MDKTEKQVALMMSSSRSSSTGELLKYMISHTLRHHLQHDAGNGRLYFITDYEGEYDFSREPASDVILFDDLSDGKDIAAAQRLASFSNKSARLIVPFGSRLLKDPSLHMTRTVLTYSLDDPSANMCANKITESKDGGFDVEFVYQSSPDGKSGFMKRMFPTYNKNMFVRYKVNSLERADILSTIKAISFCTALKIETGYLRQAIGEYVFESMASRKNPTGEIRSQGTSSSPSHREKEIDFD